MLRLVFDPPKFGMADEVKNLLKKPPKKKGELPKFWTHKERVLVGAILVLTVLLSVYFWYKGQGAMPQLKILEIGGFGLSGTVEVR